MKIRLNNNWNKLSKNSPKKLMKTLKNMFFKKKITDREKLNLCKIYYRHKWIRIENQIQKYLQIFKIISSHKVVILCKKYKKIGIYK